MNTVNTLKAMLIQMKKSDYFPNKYFKTGPGDYAEHDRFMGVPVPSLRQIARQFTDLPLQSLEDLLRSPMNEERLVALLILINQYQQGSAETQQTLYEFYLAHLPFVNNWNLVDASSHLIMGAHLLNTDKDILLSFAKSSNLWERRIAIVATWYFIRHQQFDVTLQIAKILLNDTHDLIHKAVGWMLREIGKREVSVLRQFLNQYAAKMPRTMLRYAIEKFSIDERQFYLSMKKVALV